MLDEAASNNEQELFGQSEAQASSFQQQIGPAKLILNNNTQIPSLGVSIESLKAEFLVKDVVSDALKAGYRMFATSPMYNNEIHLHNALKELLPIYKLQRSDIFISTKLLPGNFGQQSTTEAGFLASFKNLGSEYIDLFLVEEPGNIKFVVNMWISKKHLENTWSTLIEMYNNKKVLALGVSNFSVEMLEDLMSCHQGVIPVVNQVDWMPYISEKRLYEYCKENQILIQSYDTLNCPISYILLRDPVIVKISKFLEKKPSEILIYWALKRNVALIPRSTTIKNMYIDTIPLDFTIPDYLMQSLDNLIEANWLDCVD